MFYKLTDYTEAAKKNEVIFRLILDKFKKKNADFTIDEIYHRYSKGDRYGIWTILGFEEKESGVFEFIHEDIATMSGSGGADLWTMEDGKLKKVKNISFWMS